MRHGIESRNPATHHSAGTISPDRSIAEGVRSQAVRQSGTPALADERREGISSSQPRSAGSGGSRARHRPRAWRRPDRRLADRRCSAHACCFFPSFVSQFEKQNPGVRIELFEAGAAKLLMMIAHGELHFAVTLELGHGHLAKRLIPPVQLLVLTAPRSRYGENGKVAIETLGDVPLLVMPPGYATRETFDAACRIAGVHGSVTFESASLSTLAAFAEAGHGAAIVPATFRRKGEHVRIGTLELRRKPVTMPLAILWDDNKPLPRFAENFPELFAAHVKTLMRDARSK